MVGFLFRTDHKENNHWKHEACIGSMSDVSQRVVFKCKSLSEGQGTNEGRIQNEVLMSCSCDGTKRFGCEKHDRMYQGFNELFVCTELANDELTNIHTHDLPHLLL